MKMNLHFRDLYMAGEEFFFSSVEINGLFYGKKGKNEAKFIADFPGEDLEQPNLHSQLVQYGNRLYFIPLNGRGIDICCLDGTKMETIPYENGKNMQIISAFLIGSDIILLPFNFRMPFLIFHTADYSYERIGYIGNAINKVIQKEKFWMDTFSAAVNEEILYIALPGTNILLENDLGERNVKVWKLDDGIRLNAIEYFNGKLFLSALGSSNILVYEIEDGKTRAIGAGLPVGRDDKENIVISDGSRLYGISPYFITALNDAEDCFERIADIPPEFCKRRNCYRLFAGKRVLGGAIWLFSASGGGMLCLENDELKLFRTFADNETKDKISALQIKRIKKEMGADRYMVENQCENIDLKIFMDFVLQEPGGKINHGGAGQIGINIWKSLENGT